MIEYDPQHWSSHFLDYKGSMVREIIGRVASCMLWATLIVFVHHRLEPQGLSLAIPEAGHSLIGVALGLLLVFRTNASYDRFWEGRKQWGSIVNETRNMARGAVVCLKESPELVRQCIAWTIVFPWTAMDRLRGVRGAIRGYSGLREDEVRAVSQSEHPSLATAINMTAVLDEARRRGMISDWIFAHLDQNVQILIDCIGACERIHNTPMPFAYMVHLRRAVMVYCFTLPFALLDKFGWATVPVTFVIAYTLLGIEEIGVEIEDPFGDDENDLPLEGICRKIETTLSSLIPHDASHVEETPSETSLEAFPTSL